MDNIGAIFMAENVTATKQSRHIDTRYHFVREFVFDNFIRIIFVKTIDNRADPFTKNITSEIISLLAGMSLAMLSLLLIFTHGRVSEFIH